MNALIDVLKQAENTTFQNEDGQTEKLSLLPPLNEEEIQELESHLPCPIPEETKELFKFCRGFEGILESVYFSGIPDNGIELEVFPYAIPIAHDGYGNFWIVDLTKESTSWGPIFFACHDAPVIVFQTHSLAHFVQEVLRFGNPPYESEINDVHEKYQLHIWRKNPGMLSHEQCINSDDSDLHNFAQTLSDDFLICDLRNPQVGDGFSWGRYGAQTVIKRYGHKRLFAYQIQPSFWQRLFKLNT